MQAVQSQITSDLAAITVMGSGRLGPTASALLGLVGTIVGGLALARVRRGTSTGSGLDRTIERRGAGVALVSGTIGLAFGVPFLVNADGGPGTGNGVVGSAAAIVLGPIAIVLGALARARRRHVGAT
jgi:hypothetical protein